jgi:dihydrofolate reductase
VPLIKDEPNKIKHMRKIIISNMVTVDGYFAGPNGEIDWHVVDKEFNEYAKEMLESVDTLLFGKITYDLMAGYWPTDAGIQDSPVIAKAMNSLAKIVFSKTLKKADWKNTKIMKEINPEEIKKLKEQPGKDMVILGSGIIVDQFTNLGLIDEYRLIVNPVILGKGKPLFKDVDRSIKLKLLKTKTFKSGNVLLYYQPV